MSAAISFRPVLLGCAVPIIKRLIVLIYSSEIHRCCRIHKRLSPFRKVGYNESGSYHRTERTEAGMCL
ncbi:hypothetical protein PC41400_27600 [Paenibacillus chitinolyticus]|uniref:Uncharacterized protein n=1 Tax=Paenibacillus chitinolyticus TaxID=79263 RepID=A0A410X3Q6_9BACL|nr:hypothetical protein PC41400_27600 [Paenibacillus chitinolyticus]